MAHPFAEHRQTKVEHSRVGALTKGYATGGAVSTETTAPAKKSGGPVKGVMRMDGGGVKARADKVNRARGGRTKSKGHTVNVIVAPGGNKPSMALPTPPPVAAAPPMPPRPPMAPPPGMAPPGAGPMPPPGMPMRAKGGAVNSKDKQVPFKQNVKPDLNLSGNDRSKKSEADKAGAGKGRTMISHDRGKNDGDDIGRKAVITKATGGPITSRGANMAPHARSGAGGGLSRLDKQHHPAKYEC